MIKKYLRRIFLLISIIIITPAVVFAQGKFSNAITNIDLNKTAEGIVKVNIYTKNPYEQKVKINKKPDNKYVIFLPQTDNWMKSSPSTASTNDYIKNINLKTQASSVSNIKGYTKIFIESKKPIEIVPQTFVYKTKTNQDDIQNAANTMESIKIVEKAVPISIETPASNSKIETAPTTTVATQAQPAKRPIIRPTQKTFIPKNFPVEIIDLPRPKNIIDSEDTDSFLLIPTKEEQIQPTDEITIDVKNLSKALMKDTPKKLSIKSKFHIRPFNNIKSKVEKLFSLEYNLKFIKLTIKFLALAIPVVISIFFLYKKFGKKRETEEIIDETNNSLIENEELKKAIEEFEKLEESVEKLEPKVYIKDVDSYRNLDGFKKEEMPDDILKTLDAIEKAKKNASPFVPLEEDNKIVSFNYSNDKYLLKSPLEDLTEDEEKALFDDEEDSKEEAETFSSKYYNSSDEVFIIEDEQADKNNIFIIENYEENEEILDDVEEILNKNSYISDVLEELEPKADVQNNAEVEVENEVKTEAQLEPEFASDVENLKLKIKFEISDDKGIALLKYHDITALIGYIGSEIVVLKRFEDEIVPEELSVRLSERVDEETQRYIVKVGAYKGLVEVKPTSIRLLLNL